VFGFRGLLGLANGGETAHFAYWWWEKLERELAALIVEMRLLWEEDLG
jgi:hypothetical protein